MKRTYAGVNVRTGRSIPVRLSVTAVAVLILVGHAIVKDVAVVGSDVSGTKDKN